MQIQYVCDTPFFLKSKKGKYPVKKRYFTLVELLVVVGIVVILAGLVLPAVIGGAQQGRITQAKSDMKAIQMALAQMDQTYGRILVVDSSKNANFKFTASDDKNIAPKKQDAADGVSDTEFVVIGPAGNKFEYTGTNTTLDGDDEKAYDALIAELTGTWNYTGNYAHNTRKLKFLDPNSNFEPDKKYDDAANKPHLWRDPWGNRYCIMISVDGNERLVKPDVPSKSKYIMSKVAVYSRGPNGEDNKGKNASEGGDKLDDDIATWHK